MLRWPAAHITMSEAPVSSMSAAACRQTKDDTSDASTAQAPPIMSKVLVSRDASVLLVKLPVSSRTAG